jgi:ribose transport system substrate-binding protein
MAITGLGPHGERAVPGDQVKLSDADGLAARERHFTVAVVLHTTTSDWSRQELAGIVTALGRYSAAVIEVVDCGFNSEMQVEALRRLIAEKPDAIISIPIGNNAVAAAHRAVSDAGIKLVLLDNAPTGLLPGTDYTSVVSADNFGLGAIGAELLSPFIPQGGTAGILAYGIDFYATHEREIAFRKWMGNYRPDVHIARAKFPDVSGAGAAALELARTNPEMAGLFSVWDVPAMAAVNALREGGSKVAMTTIDLGNQVASELAADGLIVGIGAQKPFDQGVAAGNAALLTLLGHHPPPWIALPGLAVTQQNLVAAYQLVWHSPAPADLLRARKTL